MGLRLTDHVQICKDNKSIDFVCCDGTITEYECLMMCRDGSDSGC